MNYCAAIGRCVLVSLNIVFLLVSLLFIGAGVVLKFVPGEIFHFIDSFTQKLPFDTPKTLDFLPIFDSVGVALIVFGCVLLFMCILGFCWVCFGWKPFLVFFAVVLVILVATQATVGGMFLVEDSVLQENIRGSLKEKLIEEEKAGHDAGAYTLLANLLSSILNCCGYTGVSDFDVIKNDKTRTQFDYWLAMMPCCTKEALSANTTMCASNEKDLNTKGCYDKLFDLLEESRVWIIVVFVIILLVQVLAVVLAVVLVLTGKNNKAEVV